MLSLVQYAVQSIQQKLVALQPLVIWVLLKEQPLEKRGLIIPYNDDERKAGRLLLKKIKLLLAVNFYNFETLERFVGGSKVQRNSSLILQLSERSLQYLGIEPAIEKARVMLKEFNVEGWLHLDHGSSIEIIAKCLDAGFDSVMIDASEKPFDENVRITKEAVKVAARYNATC